MKGYSIRQHVTWLTLMPLLLMAVSLESFFLHDRFVALDDELAGRGKLIAGQLALGSEYGVFSNNQAFLQNLAQGVLQQLDVQGVKILDANFVPLIETGILSGSNSLRVLRPIIPDQVLLDELDSIHEARQIGTVIVQMSKERTSELKTRLFWVTVGATLLFMVFPYVLIHLASRNIVIPIRRLSEVVQSLGEGHLETRASVSERVDELAILAHGINEMAEKLQQENVVLHQRMEDAVRIAAVAFESHEGMMIVDSAMMIIRVNTAFSRITGYSEAEIVGNTPRLLQSGYHDASFYEAMWESISATGLWQGEIVNRRKSGETYPAWVNITAVSREDGEIVYYIATYTDITARKAAEDEIRNMAFNDALTKLPNRRMLMDRLEHTIAASYRDTRYGALMFIDLDNFKPLNDEYGHEAGDQLLIEAAQRLLGCVREVDTVARFGGDEFVVLLSELDADVEGAVRHAAVVAEKIRSAMAKPYCLKPHKAGVPSAVIEHTCTSSIGVCMFLGHQFSADEIIKRADLSMYGAKREGRNSIHFCGNGS